MKNLSLLNKLLYLLNLLLVVLWVLAFLAPYINPKTFSVGAVLAIAYPLLLLTHLFFAVYWLTRFNKVIYLSVGVLLISYFFSVPIFNTKSKFKALAKDQSFSILSYNTQSFYHAGGSQENVSDVKANIAHYLNQQNADVVCLQEARKGFSSSLNYPYKSLYGFNQIYSRYEIVSAGNLAFNQVTTNASAYADIILNYDTIRIYNLHLESLHLGSTDYTLINGNERTTQQEVSEKTQELSNKISSASAKRVEQINTLLSHVKSSPYPTLLCGDFNDVSQSYIYRRLTQKHTDAFLASGKGFGATFRKLLFPFRIDYILYPSNWAAYNFEVLEVKLSDHQAIRCDIEVP